MYKLAIIPDAVVERVHSLVYVRAIQNRREKLSLSVIHYRII